MPVNAMPFYGVAVNHGNSIVGLNHAPLPPSTPLQWPHVLAYPLALNLEFLWPLHRDGNDSVLSSSP